MCTPKCKHCHAHTDKWLVVVVLTSAAAFVGAFMTLAFGLNSIAQVLLCTIMLLQLWICWYTFMLKSIVSAMSTAEQSVQPDLVGPDGV
jgi:fatty acid desaturase